MYICTTKLSNLSIIANLLSIFSHSFNIKSAMYEISTSLYREVGERLIETIGTREFFSGSIHLTHGEVDCQLTCTLIIERGERTSEGHCFRPITALIPIWWEFHTYIDDEEKMNDFSFGELTALSL